MINYILEVAAQSYKDDFIRAERRERVCLTSGAVFFTTQYKYNH